MYNSKDKDWVEASAEKKEDEVSHILYVNKPLLGYDLLKSSGCEEEELKEQPFVRERWGFKEKEEVIPTCYLLTLRYEEQTASQMYPDNCVEESTTAAKDKDLEGDEEEDDSHRDEAEEEDDSHRDEAEEEDDSHIYEAEEEDDSHRDEAEEEDDSHRYEAEEEDDSHRYKAEEENEYHSSHKRNTYSTFITQLSKKKIGNMRKFVCKASHTYMGASISLGSAFLEATAKIYYKPENNADWGDHLLDLSWDQYSGGEDSFVSWVSQQHLNQQGVKWRKCFKCEVTVGGETVRRCRGECSCD